MNKFFSSSSTLFKRINTSQRSKRICNIGTIGLILCMASLSNLASGAPTIELVQSVPLETTLEVPGIRKTQEVWLEMIKSAQNTIDLEQFYINNQPGESLQPVIDALRKAASDNVQIRLLLDSQFYKNYSQVPNELSQIPNIQVRLIDYSSLGGIQHSKYFIVDQGKAFIGSANFDWLALSHIHEVGLQIQDPKMVKDLSSVFSKDWESGTAVSTNATKPLDITATPIPTAVTSVRSSDFQLLASPPRRNPTGIQDSLTAILDVIGKAKTTLKIQVYEYTSQLYHSSKHWPELNSALTKAAARGVQVQLLVDAVDLKSGKADLTTLARTPNIQVRTVKIPEWSGGPLQYARLIHSKYFSVDSTISWVGTENWSEDYFTNSRNVGVMFNSPEISAQLELIFEQVWKSSYTTTL